MKSFILSIVFLFAGSAFAQDYDYQKHFNRQGEVAVHGYDVVSYYDGVPAIGSDSFIVDYKGLQFKFSSEGNAQKFLNNPESFIPAYGGWCATAIAMMNRKLDVNPDSFVIQDGKLFLFSTSMGPAKNQWVSGQPAIKQRADSNWNNMIRN